jgi:hypothetical protein
MRELIRERTQAGLKSARGRKGGRSKGMSQSAMEKAEIAEALYKNGTIPVKKSLNNWIFLKPPCICDLEMFLSEL